VVAVVAVAALSSCGGGAVRPAGVVLVPDRAAVGRHWSWSPSCPAAQNRGDGCAPEGRPVGTVQLNADAWNLGPSSQGVVTMSADGGGALTIAGRFATAPPCDESTCVASRAGTWVRGYPSVLYGLDQCHAATSARPSRALSLPVRVGAIPPDLVGTTTYNVGRADATYDVAYDLWLDPSATSAPCQHDGTLEIMVWTDYDARALLPGSGRLDSATVPYATDGTRHAGTNAWSVYADNIEPDGHTAPWGGTLWFILDRADLVAAGSVRVDLSGILSAAGDLLRQDFGWDGIDGYWLDTVPFGIEFGPHSATAYGQEPMSFSLRLSAYCLAPGSTVASAPCPRA